MTGSDDRTPAATLVVAPADAAVVVDASGADISLQKARALQRLAPGVAHDLRNHVGGFKALGTLMRAVMSLSDEDREMLDQLELSVDRASRLFEAFTLLAREREATRQAVRLGPAVEGALALAAFGMMHVTQTVTLPPDLPEVGVDALRLHQALVALLVAEQDLLGAPKARGALDVRARLVPGSEPRLVELTVEDDAPGVPVDGVSLDIAVARRLLELDGGSLRHEAGSAGGNRFVVTLRVHVLPEPEPEPATAPAPAPRPESEPAPRPQSGPERASERQPATAADPFDMTVLICDDEAPIRILLARLLARDGIGAVTAASGTEALEILDRVHVDVVMSDHRMSGMSGTELQAAVATRHPHLAHRFILLSGDPGDPDLVAFAASEGLDVLPKPFEPGSSLPAIIREVAAR
ncbi:MAG TPA: response regulator [Candidatus Limnocylindrales bacterium]|nr:response regulator [Candidatus Limnocylindrales bacterium]